MKNSLSKKVLSKIIKLLLIFNIILTTVISYVIFDNYYERIEENLNNIEVSAEIMLKTSNGSNEELQNIVRSLKSSYGVQGLIANRGKSIIINSDIDNIIDVESLKFSEKNVTLQIVNSFTNLKGIISFPVYIYGDYIGNMIIVNDYTNEYMSLIGMVLTIIIAQIILLAILYSILWDFINKQIEPLKILEERMETYGGGSSIECIDIKTGDEIESLNNSFNKMVMELDEEKKKSRGFFNNVTHELKTPITAIWGYVQALRRKEIEDIKPEFRNRAFNRMELESQKMLKQIEVLLDISRGQVNNSNFKEEVNLKEIINIVKGKVEETYKDRVFNINNEYSIVGVYNKEEITTIIYNLLENAAKYSKSNEIIIGFLENEKKGIYIENEIYAIPEDKKEHLLEPFVKYNPNINIDGERKVSSSGLGLYLVSTLVEVNNIKLKYEINDSKIRFILLV